MSELVAGESMFNEIISVVAIAIAPTLPDRPTAAARSVGGFVADYQFLDGVQATKPNDKVGYVLIGSPFGSPEALERADSFVPSWLKQHPRATVMLITRAVQTGESTKKRQETVYIWIEDGPDCLNVDLVRAGVFTADQMRDYVDSNKRLSASFKRQTPGVQRYVVLIREKIRKNDRFTRLISDEDYESRINRFLVAETAEKMAWRKEKMIINDII